MNTGIEMTSRLFMNNDSRIHHYVLGGNLYSEPSVVVVEKQHVCYKLEEKETKRTFY